MIHGAWNGHYFEVENYLMLGVNVNSTDDTGKTALMMAVMGYHIEIVKLLLKWGADPFQKNDDDKTAIDIAKEYEFSDIAEIIINTNYSYQSMIDAIECADLNNINKLLDECLSINHRNKTCQTLLYIAIENVSNEKGYRVVEHLIEKGADIYNIAPDNYNALHYAAYYVSLFELLKFLINRGEDINFQMKYNKLTPVMTAIFTGNLDAIKLLCENGADLNLQDSNGENAVEYAKRWSSKKDIIEYLEKEMEKQNEKNRSDNNNDKINVQLLNHQNENGNTALMIAISNGHYEIAKLLLNKGCDKTIKNKDNETALILAARKGATELVDLILS